MSWSAEGTGNTNFGVLNSNPERTLRYSNDAYSGIKLTGSLFENTQQSLDELNEDGRYPLGLFYFEEDNIGSTNFPIKFDNPIFNQISTNNLIKNGDCRQIDKTFITSSGGTPLIFRPKGGWQYINLQGLIYHISGLGITDDDLTDTNERFIRAKFGKFVESIPTNNYDNGNRSAVYDFYIQSQEDKLDQQFQYGYGGFYPYSPLRESYWYQPGTDPRGEQSRSFDTSAEQYHRDNRDELISAYINGEDVEIPQRNPNTGVDGEIISGSYGDTHPEQATWIRTDEAFSNNKCLVFHSRSEWTGSDDKYRPYLLPQSTVEGPMIENEKYRTLNQRQQIYNFTDESINPFSSLKIKFKMKTVNMDGASMPEVETGIMVHRE